MAPNLPSAQFMSAELAVTVWQRPVVRIHLSANWQTMAAGTELFATISGLQPATHYKFRVVAENELGAGEPSENIAVRTEGEAPTGEPQSLSVTAMASDQLRVTWAAPVQHLWNGEILGYYVGYREHGLGRAGGYNFTTVSAKNSGSGAALLTGLKKYRKYGVVVQAFNEKGPGPTSNEVIAQTLEDGHIEAETKVTSEINTELHGLQKYSNYSIQVWAYTQIGDGVKSNPIFCLTDEDGKE
uniref:Fibronectin type-III domain-containing protein n=1 Tax=Timema bartmani TaxID=61472 RepID=A0A7R9EW03_9NEOP|nr:unnamed protein product [Timema bartmani]